jgi:cytochrome b561
MPLRSTEHGWGALVRAFHWLVAALIVAQGVIGLSMVQMDLTPAKVRVFALHKSIGMTILALVLLRIAWRLTERRPADPPAMPHWQRQAAHALTGGLDPVWKPRALLLHQTLFWVLAALLVGHVGAALWHHFGQRDDVLRRMAVGSGKPNREVRP